MPGGIFAKKEARTAAGLIHSLEEDLEETGQLYHANGAMQHLLWFVPEPTRRLSR